MELGRCRYGESAEQSDIHNGVEENGHKYRGVKGDAA